MDLNYTNQIVNYLRKNLKKGYTKESLRWALVNQGHSRMEIEKAFRKLEQEMARKAPILKTKPEIKYERIAPNDFSTKPDNKKVFSLKRFFD